MSKKSDLKKLTEKDFERGWTHFCHCINFSGSAMDAEAIDFMLYFPMQVFELIRQKDPQKGD